VIYKARHTSPSSEFESMVHKVELFLFIISRFSDCFLPNDPAFLFVLSFVGPHVSMNLFMNVFIFLTCYSIQPPKLTSARFCQPFGPSWCRPLHEVCVLGLLGGLHRIMHALLVYYWSSDASRGSFQNIFLVFSDKFIPRYQLCLIQRGSIFPLEFHPGN
jgi:hypothetical protein